MTLLNAFKSQIHPGKSFCTEYEKSKFLADRIALQAAAEGVPITIVYPGVMYGPGTLTSGNLVCRVVRELSPFDLAACITVMSRT